MNANPALNIPVCLDELSSQFKKQGIGLMVAETGASGTKMSRRSLRLRQILVPLELALNVLVLEVPTNELAFYLISVSRNYQKASC